jgi:cell division protein FtsB
MTSAVDPTKPTAGAALTADVRSNFQAAHDEIEALQARVTTLETNVTDLQNRVTALEAKTASLP